MPFDAVECAFRLTAIRSDNRIDVGLVSGPLHIQTAPSFNGRTADSGSAYRGSNPWGAAKSFQSLPRIPLLLHFLLVRPSAEWVSNPAGRPTQYSSRTKGPFAADGGITIQGFLRAGLIQRLVITRVPVLIGEGIPLFARLSRDVQLRHIATRHYSSGLVQSEYHIAA